MSLRALSVCDSVLSTSQPRQVRIECGLFIIHFTDVTLRHKLAVQLTTARIGACPHGFNEFFTPSLLYKIKIGSQWGQLTGHAAA